MPTCAIIDNTGKIGKCYTSDGSAAGVSTNFNFQASEFSIAAWVRINTRVNAWRCPIKLIHSTEKDYIGFCCEHNTQSSYIGFHFYKTIDSTNTPIFDTYPITDMPIGEWVHLTVTYNGKTAIYYKNGIEVNSSTIAAAKQNAIANIDRIIMLGSDGGRSGAAVKSSLNDVRIYDHCLSAAEVKEISQGLVLHYKLDGGFCGVNYNLAYGSKLLTTTSGISNKNISKRGASTLETRSDGFAQTKCTAAWQGFSLWSNALNLTVGTTYTYSFYGYTNSTNNTNAAISFYPMMYNSAGTRDTSSTLPISVQGGSFTNANAKQIGKLNTIPTLYWATFTWNQTMADILSNSGKIELSIQVHGTFTEGRIDYLWAPKLEIGNKPTAWIPTCEEMNIDITQIQDSSGYNHNGQMISNINISNDTMRYNISALFDGVDDCIIVPYNTICPENIFTINLWFKKDALGSKNYETLFGGPSGFEMDTRSGSSTALSLYMASTRGGNAATGLQLNTWYMVTMVRDGTNERYYINGELKKEIEAKAMPTGIYRIGAWNSNTGQNYYGNISDFRIYCTPLLDTDIKQLYNVGMKVDKQQNIHAFDVNEQLFNIMYKPNFAIGAQTWQDGLNRYTQSNCQVNLTNDGVYVYRPANLNQTDNGNTMYGGLKIVNSTVDNIHVYDSTIDNIFNLQKGHTYIWVFHVKGNTTNAPSFQINNNMGWGGGGLSPTPSNVTIKNISSNFNGETEVWYKFTINDDIVKTCTSAYSSFVANNQYLSYKHFGWNWSYATTGNGTNIYITNIRLYDITNMPTGKLTKSGIIKFSSIFEVNNTIHLTKNEDLILNQFIER